MKSLLYYLLQVIVASGILYGYYHLALRNNKFHHYNRFYLLLATILSITVPFLNIPVYFTQSATESSFVLETLTEISSTGTDSSIVFSRPETHTNWFTWENVSFLFYILVASVILFRIIFSLLKIRRIVRNNPTEQLGKIHFVNTDEPGTPFSFFRWLFWNKKIELHSEKGEQIFRHELFHIEQKHSWDTIHMELLTLIFWINPFFYLIRKELKAIHEFLADQFAVTENTKWQYAEFLVMQVLNTQQHLVQPFFNTQIKRRIAMITTSKKPSYQYLRKVMTLPLLALVAMLFAFTYKKVNESEKITLDNNNQPMSDSIPQKVVKLNLPYNTIVDSVRVNAPYSEYKNSDGKTIFQADSIVFRSNSDISGNTFANSLVIIDGEKQPENFSKTNTKIMAQQVVVYDKNNAEAINKYGDDAKKGVIEFVGATIIQDDPLIVINGVIQPGGKEALQSISPNSIKTVNVLKDRSAVTKYGQIGVNGVIEIITGDYVKVVEVPLRDTLNPVKKDNQLSNVIPGHPTKKQLDEMVVGGYTVKRDNNAKVKRDDVKEVTVQGYQIKEKRKDLKEVIVPGYHIKETKKELNEVVVAGYSIKRDNTNPTFPGGKEAWQRYLMVNINANVAVDSSAPAGIYKTIVRFIVQTDGSITDIKAITKNGYGTEKEAIRMISKGPKWIPATRDGKAINAYVEQPITFQVQEEVDDSPVVVTNKTINNNEKGVEKTANIYPNPVNNIVTIPLSSPIAGTALIQVVDIAGNISLIQRSALNKGVNSITINTSTLKSGAYIINLNHPDGTKRSYKMIKE